MYYVGIIHTSSNKKHFFKKNDYYVGLVRTVKKVWIQEEHSKSKETTAVT